MSVLIEKQQLTYHYNLQQGSEDWHELHLGKLTGSTASVFLAEGKIKDFGVGAMTLIYRKAGELITGESDPIYTNAVMERGIELEPIAIRAYEEETYNQVRKVGFVELNAFVGCSPDGLIGEDGIIEVKCPMHTEFVRYADQKNTPKDYFAQMQFNLFVTGRKWCDYIVYHPGFKEPLLIKTVERNEKIIDRFKLAAEYFEKEVRRLWVL